MNKTIKRLKHDYYLYFLPFFKYFSLKKFGNLLLNLYEFKTGKVILKSTPFLLYFDVANICLLNCPLCPTGNRKKGQTKGTMKFDDFKKVFDQFKEKLFFVWLYNWGEPFLCKDVFKIIDYCHQSHVGVYLHTNLNFYDENLLKNIVKHKIDYLSVSIDGISQKNYQFYREGGNLKKALDGLRKIMKFKREYRAASPAIVWQFLINNHNKDEVKKARRLAKKLKVNVFEARPLLLFTEIDSRYSHNIYQKFLGETSFSEAEACNPSSSQKCHFLWHSLTINPDTSFAPCCAIYLDKDNFGSFKNSKKNNQDLDKIINSLPFTESRKMFVNQNYSPIRKTACSRCDWYTKS